jgi:anti-sigma factor RsiW
MSEQRLNEHVKDHYTYETLRPEKLAQLLAQADTEQLKSNRWVALRKSWMIAAVAALIAVGVPLTLWQRASSDEWSAVAAHEIALNHKKQLAIEFPATDYASLRAQMSKLDFVLTAPARLPIEGLQVVGARYCSIQGHLAAQVRLQDRDGRSYTLYQRTSHGVPTLAAEQQHVIDGVQIREWQEAGLFFGFAASP